MASKKERERERKKERTTHTHTHAMDHVAIMQKATNMIDLILSGEKTIESRWYMTRRAPWNKIKPGDTIYFKYSGGLVAAKALVGKVMQFEGLDEQKTKEILRRYGQEIGIQKQGSKFNMYKGKKYCILMFLQDVCQLEEEFDINKKGFGQMSSWITVPSVQQLRSHDDDNDDEDGHDDDEVKGGDTEEEETEDECAIDIIANLKHTRL